MTLAWRWNTQRSQAVQLSCNTLGEWKCWGPSWGIIFITHPWEGKLLSCVLAINMQSHESDPPLRPGAIRLLSEVHKMLTSWFWLIHLPTESVVDKTWIWRGIYGSPSLFSQSWDRVCQTALPGFDHRRRRDCFHRNLQHFIFSHHARAQRAVWCLDRWENLFLNDYKTTQGPFIE